MCGIAGLVAGSTWSGPAPGQVAASMAGRLTHRGPDAGDVWQDGTAGVALAHRRLSIIDLSPTGAQPMASGSGRYVVTYNGELYGHTEVRQHLERAGHAFRGRSDTEVLLAAVEEWGIDDALARTDGMYAFALWDRADRVLTLVRDRMGEKPLYHGVVGGAFVFASELKAFDAVPGFAPTVDRAAVAAYLRLKYVPAPWTIWQGVSKLGAGEILTVPLARCTEPVRPRTWWSCRDAFERGAQHLFDGSDEEAQDHLAGLVREAARTRVVADVPIGALLSGGIDSTVVVAAAQEVSSSPVRTFTVGSTDASVDESRHAREVARVLGTEHTELTVTEQEALDALPDLPAVYDEPFGDSSGLPTLLISRLARQHVTVALSGDGGDELFGGYNRYVWIPRLWERLRRVPAPARALLARATAAVPEPAWESAVRLLPERRRPRLPGLKAAKVASVAGLPGPEAMFGRLVSHWDDPTSVAVGGHEHLTLTHRPDDWPALPLVDRMRAVDCLTYLPDDILAKVDRAAMSTSLETRPLLLAPAVVEFAATLPSHMVVRDGRGKWLLRRLAERHVPADVLDRPKAGFGVPIGAWLRGPLRPWAEELLGEARLSRDGLLRPAPVRRAWHDHLSGRHDRSYELWDVLQLQAWLADRAPTSG